jgi:glycosyltransferase involved in cell wall biosynthesis/predicted O-methyltransferase YrrM
MTNKNSKIYLLSMIRNDGDIIEAFLNHALLLFDEIMLVDVRSTDGTSEILSEYAKQNSNIKIYSIDTQEKFQSAMMNTLARRAFDDGADWIFFLDADEFLNIPSKLDLLSGLNKSNSSVIHIPWINLVPSTYGTFADFEINQIYYWTGRVSKYNKIAVNGSYISLNPDFYIHEGNHEISSSLGSDLEPINFKFSILHLPIRSFDRLRYKILIAWRTLLAKTNRLPSEGDHVIRIKEMIDRGILGIDELNYLSAYYGDFGEQVKPVLLSATGWPTVEMYNNKNNNESSILYKRSVQQTQLLDSEQSWITTNFGKKDIAMAVIENETDLKIVPSPVRGDGVAYRKSFKRLGDVNPSLPSQINAHSIISALDASFIKVDEMPFSAWSELVPALYAMFSFFKPRRYVELGSHYGMSYFAACQAAQHLDLASECIAVDSWVGDIHAGYHSTEVFDSFKSTIASKYPSQFYIKGFFSEALKSFEDGSVDLLHIDGYHTYEAVKDDFETWQPKMSNNGVVIFHDINVFERGFGVWRYWKELTERYPNFHLSHMHGLGILYVGDSKTVISDLFDILQKNTENGIIDQIWRIFSKY